jgi:integrase
VDETGHKSGRDIVSRKANTGALGELERMARRRFQDPTLQKRGLWWTIRVWEDVFENGLYRRSYKRVRLAQVATTSERDARRLAAEHVRPMNQGLDTVGSATNFEHYVEKTYIPVVLPTLASTTRGRYQGVLDNYLVPRFGKLCLRDLTPETLQRYFSGMATSPLSTESRDKIRDVLASVLNSAITYRLLIANPIEGVRMPVDTRPRRRNKPHLSPEQFEQLIAAIPEPYSTMVYVAIFTGLRVSELAALRWEDVHADSITIDERFCRGDFAVPKSESSNATIAVNRCVIERIHRLRLLTVNVRAGRATRKYRVVKSDRPEDLDFQSVRDGKPMRDNNILCRFIKPAARTLGMPWANWRCLRTSHATWLKLAGADVKDAQAQMRHSRASTTLDIYQQFVPESQQRVVERLSMLAPRRIM